MGPLLFILVQAVFDGGTTAPTAALLRQRLPDGSTAWWYLGRPRRASRPPTTPVPNLGRAYRWVEWPRWMPEIIVEEEIAWDEDSPFDWPDPFAWEHDRAGRIPQRYVAPTSDVPDLVPWPELTK